jgi:ferredoxin-nitrite reductase
MHAEAAAICGQIVRFYAITGRASGATKAWLTFPDRELGPGKFRKQLERRVDRPLASAGIDQRAPKHTDHIGVFRQKQAEPNYVGLAVPVGRMTSEQMLQVTTLAETTVTVSFDSPSGKTSLFRMCPTADRRAHLQELR